MIAKNNSGFTILELLAVFVILFLILTFAVPRVMATISNANIAADESDLATLNRVTSQYAYFLELEDLKIPEEFNQQVLLDARYIIEILEPRQKNLEFKWNQDIAKWIFIEKPADEPSEPGSGGFDSGGNDYSGSDWFDIVNEETGEIEIDESYIENESIIVSGINITVVKDEDDNNQVKFEVGADSGGHFLVKPPQNNSYTIEANIEIKLTGNTGDEPLQFGIYFETDKNVNTESNMFKSIFTISTGNNRSRTNSLTYKDGDSSKVVSADTTTGLPIEVKETIKIHVNKESVRPTATVEINDQIIGIFNNVVFDDTGDYSGIFVSRPGGNTDSVFYNLKIIPYEN